LKGERGFFNYCHSYFYAQAPKRSGSSRYKEKKTFGMCLLGKNLVGGRKSIFHGRGLSEESCREKQKKRGKSKGAKRRLLSPPQLYRKRKSLSRERSIGNQNTKLSIYSPVEARSFKMKRCKYCASETGRKKGSQGKERRSIQTSAHEERVDKGAPVGLGRNLLWEKRAKEKKVGNGQHSHGGLLAR